MKFASVLTAAGPAYGVVTPDGLVLASDAWLRRYPSLREAIAGDALAELAAAPGGRIIPLETAEFLPTVPHPGKMICVGKNYAAHAAESGDKPASFPSLFPRFAETLVAHGQPLVRPRASSDFDYEGELALVIGRPGRHIAEADALRHVAGYTCFNDASVRDYQFNHSLLAGKNFAGTGGLGPVLTTADEVGDPAALEVITRLNGDIVQHGHTRDMIFGCAWLVAYISSFIALAAGDVIATGTPEGVGFARKPPLWLRPGDTVEVSIPRVGTLSNPVAAE